MEKQQSKNQEKRLRLQEIIPDDEMRTEMLSRLYKGDPILGDKGIFTNLLQSFVNLLIKSVSIMITKNQSDTDLEL